MKNTIHLNYLPRSIHIFPVFEERVKSLFLLVTHNELALPLVFMILKEETYEMINILY